MRWPVVMLSVLLRNSSEAKKMIYIDRKKKTVDCFWVLELIESFDFCYNYY